MAGICLGPNLHLAGQVVLHGSLSNASGTVMNLLHHQIRQLHINREKCLSDNSGRRRHSELAQKHGICEAIAQRYLDTSSKVLNRRRKGSAKADQGYNVPILNGTQLESKENFNSRSSLKGVHSVSTPHRLHISAQQKSLSPRRLPIPILIPNGARSLGTVPPKLSNVTSAYATAQDDCALYNTPQNQDGHRVYSNYLESQMQELLNIWKSTQDFGLCKDQVIHNMQEYDSDKSKEEFLITCMTASFNSRQIDLAGRLAVMLLERFPDIQSNWKQMIPTLTAIAAAGFIDTLRVTLDNLHNSDLLPSDESDRKAFLFVPLAVVKSQNREVNINQILEFLEILQKYNLPIGIQTLEQTISRIVGREDTKSISIKTRRIVSLANHISDDQLSRLQQYAVNSAFKGLIYRSPHQADLHYKRLKLICGHDMNLVSKDMCALVIDSMTKSYIAAQDYVRKGGKTTHGYVWNGQTSTAFNKLRMDLAIHVVQEISANVDWLPKSGSGEIWNLQPNSTSSQSASSSNEVEQKIVLSRMRQAMGQKQYHAVDETFRNYVGQLGGILPSNPSLFCIAISANLRHGNISAAMAIRQQVAAQRETDVLIADFMLEKHHIVNNRRDSLSFDDFWHIIKKWNSYDQTWNRQYFYDILIQIFKKLYRPKDLHDAAELVREIYQAESHRSPASDKKLLKTLFVAYSKSLDLKGIIWTISTAMEHQLDWDWDFQHLLVTHFRKFQREFKGDAEECKAALENTGWTNEDAFAKLRERDRAVAISQLVWGTLSRLRKLTFKVHKRQRWMLSRTSQAVLNMLLHDLMAPGTIVKKPQHLYDSKMDGQDSEEVIDEDENNLEEQEDDETLNVLQNGDSDVPVSLQMKLGSLDTDLSNPSREENLRLLQVRKKLARQATSERMLRKQLHLEERKHLTLNSNVPLLERFTNYGYISGEENLIPPEELICAMMSELEDALRAIDEEFGRGSSPFGVNLGSSSVPLQLSIVRPLPVRQRYISPSRSPWGSRSPVKVEVHPRESTSRSQSKVTRTLSFKDDEKPGSAQKSVE